MGRRQRDREREADGLLGGLPVEIVMLMGLTVGEPLQKFT